MNQSCSPISHSERGATEPFKAASGASSHESSMQEAHTTILRGWRRPMIESDHQTAIELKGAFATE